MSDDRAKGEAICRAAEKHDWDVMMRLVVENAGKEEVINFKGCEFGGTPLHGAARYRQLEVIECLVKHGAKLDATCRGGRTPLFDATVANYVEIIECLLRHGAKADATNIKGCPPIHWAAFANHTEAMECLVKHGARTDIIYDGKTALDIAREVGVVDVDAMLERVRVIHARAALDIGLAMALSFHQSYDETRGEGVSEEVEEEEEKGAAAAAASSPLAGIGCLGCYDVQYAMKLVHSFLDAKKTLL